MKRNKYKELKGVGVNIIICTLVLLICNNIRLIGDIQAQIVALSWIGIITYIICIYVYIRMVNELFTPYFFFYSSFFIFTFGQWLLYAMGIKYDYLFQHSFYSNFWDDDINIVLNSLKFSVASLAFLNMGNIFYVFFRGQRTSRLFAILPNPSIRVFNLTGWILFFLSVVPTLYIKMVTLNIALKHGYLGIYNTNIQFPIVPLLGKFSIFFIPSLIILLICNKNKRIYRIGIYMIFATYALIEFGIGGRTQAISVFLVGITFFLLQSKKKINLKKTIVIGVVGYYVLIMCVAVAEIRGLENKSLGMIFYYMKDSSGLLFKIIGELGWNLPLLLIMNIVPTKMSYSYGISYLAAIASIIPSFLDPTGFIEKATYLATEDWLTNYSGLDFGIGYSLNAEAYYNFGMYGLIVIFGLGIIFGKCLFLTREEINNITPFEHYCKLVFLYFLATIPRRGFITFIDAWVYGIIVVSVLIFIVKKVVPRNKYSV